MPPLKLATFNINNIAKRLAVLPWKRGDPGDLETGASGRNAQYRPMTRRG